MFHIILESFENAQGSCKGQRNSFENTDTPCLARYFKLLRCALNKIVSRNIHLYSTIPKYVQGRVIQAAFPVLSRNICCIANCGLITTFTRSKCLCCRKQKWRLLFATWQCSSFRKEFPYYSALDGQIFLQKHMFLGPWPDGVVHYRKLKLSAPFASAYVFAEKLRVNTAFNDIRVRIGKNLLLSGTKIYSNSIEFLTANLATGKVLLSTHFAPSSVASFLASSTCTSAARVFPVTEACL